MNEMRVTGYMHNYMRMYRGKKILEWSRNAAAGFAVALAITTNIFSMGATRTRLPTSPGFLDTRSAMGRAADLRKSPLHECGRSRTQMRHRSLCRESRKAGPQEILNPDWLRSLHLNREPPRALMEKLLQDIRFGLRQLLKKPGFAALAIISMALGIGANTSIFSLVDTVLLRPLAVQEPSQLVELYGTTHNGQDWSLQSYPNYKDYRDRNTVFSGLFVYRVVVSSLTVNNASNRVWGYLVSGNYFDVLGVKPALGRAFLPEEDATPDSHPVAVLSYNCWQRRFGGDPAIVGKTVKFNSQPFTIIGVAPKGFIGTEVAYDPEMFIPMMMAKTIEPGSRSYLDRRDSSNMFTVGRLKPGVTVAQAKAELETITAQMAKDYPENVGRGIRFGKPGLFIPDIENSVFAFTACSLRSAGSCSCSRA